MAEDNKFGDGYEAIFGKKKPPAQHSKKLAARKPAAKKPSKSAGKKK